MLVKYQQISSVKPRSEVFVVRQISHPFHFHKTTSHIRLTRFPQSGSGWTSRVSSRHSLRPGRPPVSAWTRAPVRVWPGQPRPPCHQSPPFLKYQDYSPWIPRVPLQRILVRRKGKKYIVYYLDLNFIASKEWSRFNHKKTESLDLLGLEEKKKAYFDGNLKVNTFVECKHFLSRIAVKSLGIILNFMG